MCGICGVSFSEPRVPEKAFLEEMSRTLSHRGPDEEGVFIAPGVGLGHRRLSIIDLVSGTQPIGNEDGTVQIVFNGEIYNFPELKRELEGKGHRFRTRTDTEVIVHLYEEMGEGCLERLNGMFALALWDDKRKRLFLARDRIGIKPLYYAHNGKDLAFASEPKALLKLPWVDGGLDPEGLSHYLSYDFIPAPWTIYRGIRKLPPGYRGIFEGGEFRTERYWDMDMGDRLRGLKEGDLKEVLWEEFCRSVRMRLISDVPVGVLLSGGIDSTSVLAALRYEGVSDVRTFSVGFEDPSFDESRYFRKAASFFETEHHDEILAPGTLLEIIPEVASILDEPLADASIMPTYLLSRFTRGYVKVALGGDGGDELFAGYPTYQAFVLARLYERMPSPARAVLEAVVRRLPVSFDNMSFDFRAKKFIQGIPYPPIERHYLWLGTFSPQEKEELLTDGIREALKESDSFRVLYDYLEGRAFSSELGKLLYLDTKLYLQEGVLAKVDRASMAHGLEVRVPFLDHLFVEFVTGIPEGLKLRRLKTKYIWKETIREKVPREILKRGKKGFGIPVAKWLCGELREMMLELLSGERLRRQGIFDPRPVERLIEDHLARRVDNRKKLWNLLIFQLWWDHFGRG